MQIVRRFIFAWVFALITAFCLYVSFLVASLAFHGLNRSRVFPFFVLFGLQSAVTVVFGMAWWTTWMNKPSTRAWGVAASLLVLLLPLSAMNELRFGKLTYIETALGVFSFVAYLWPDKRERARKK